MEFDLMMQDWRESDCGQDHPEKLAKLRWNLEEFREVWSGSLLDVGCNVGNLYYALGEPKDYIGVDLSPELIAKARANFPAARFEVCDLFDLNLTADVVLCSRVLMHIPDVGKAIAKLRAAAKKHCVLFVPVSFDRCEKEYRGGGFSYFRTFSSKTLREHGDCIIYKHEPYSTVIYGPGLP